MNIKTFTTKSGENALNFGSTEARYYWCKNIGNTELYVSADANITAGGDGVAVLPAGEVVMIENYDNFIYVLGAGKIEVYETNTETCPFKLALASESGEGGETLSGSTSYTVTDSVEYPLVGMKVFGKSEQKQYSGKNLLNYNNLSITSGMGAKNVNSEGIISAINKNSDSRNWTYNSSDYYIDLDKGSYIVTVIVTTATSSNNSGIQIRTSNNVLYAAGGGGNQGTGDISFLTKGTKTAKFTLNEPTTIGIMAKLYEAEIKIQIELGSTATDYEPYVGGIPSPNPDYPQEIVSVVEPTVTVCGKNLLGVTYQTTTKNGITFTNNSDGTYTLNGTATSEAVFTIVSRLDISGTYRIIGCPPNGSNGTYNISVNVDGAWSVNNYDIGNGSIINPSSYIIIAIAVRNGVTCNNLVFKPMLTTDLTATYDDFEPYTSNILPLPDTLNAIPVSSGGNVTIDGQEYIADYKDYGTGKYHKLIDPNKLDPTVSIVDNLELLLASEEITDIPESELQAYRQLQTYNGTTNISNDKGAGLSVEYCTNKALSACVAPITTGLQQQIDELKAAFLSLGGNV